MEFEDGYEDELDSSQIHHEDDSATTKEELDKILEQISDSDDEIEKMQPIFRPVSTTAKPPTSPPPTSSQKIPPPSSVNNLNQMKEALFATSLPSSQSSITNEKIQPQTPISKPQPTKSNPTAKPHDAQLLDSLLENSPNPNYKLSTSTSSSYSNFSDMIGSPFPLSPSSSKLSPLFQDDFEEQEPFPHTKDDHNSQEETQQLLLQKIKKKNRLVKFEKHLTISAFLSHEPNSKQFGKAKCIRVSNQFIAIGTSMACVLLFPIKDETKVNVMRLKSETNEYVLNQVTCIDIASTEDTLVAGYERGQVVLWDTKTFSSIRKITDQFHMTIDFVAFVKDKYQFIACNSAHGLVKQFTIQKTLFSTYVDTKTIIDKSFGSIKHVLVLQHDSWDLILMALATDKEVMLIALQPFVRVMYRLFKPEKNPSTKHTNTSSMPVLSWRCIAQKDPLLCIAWNHTLNLFSLKSVVEEAQLELFKVVSIQFPTHVTLIGCSWLSERVLCIIDDKMNICLMDPFTSKRFVEKKNLNEYPLLCHNHSVMSSKNNRLYLLCENYSCIMVQMKDWRDRINTFVEYHFWKEAFLEAIAYYNGTSVASIGLPSDSQQRQHIVSQWIQVYLFAYLNQIPPQNTSAFYEWGQVAFTICIQIQKYDYLFEEIQSIFIKQHMESIFIVLLKECIALLPSIPCHTFVQVLFPSQQYSDLEYLFLHGKVWDSQLLHQIQWYTYCQQHGLYKSMVYYWNQVKQDLYTPIALLLSLQKQEECFVYLECITIHGMQYPPNETNTTLLQQVDKYQVIHYCIKEQSFIMKQLMEYNGKKTMQWFQQVVLSLPCNPSIMQQECEEMIQIYSLTQLPNKQIVYYYLLPLALQNYFVISMDLMNDLIITCCCVSQQQQQQENHDVQLEHWMIEYLKKNNYTSEYDSWIQLLTTMHSPYMGLIAYFYHQKQCHSKALEMYLLQPQNYHDIIFDYVQSNHSTISVAKYLIPLLQCDAKLTCEYLKQNEIVSLEQVCTMLEYSYPQLLYYYLKYIPSQLTEEYKLKYFKWMCQFEPNQVFFYLKTNEQDYKLDEYLKTTQQYHIFDATAYLLERAGDILHAIQLYQQSCLECQQLMKQYIHTHSKWNPQQEDYLTMKECVKIAMEMCVRFCETNSKEMHWNEMEMIWITLLDTFVYPLRELSIYFNDTIFIQDDTLQEQVSREEMAWKMNLLQNELSHWMTSKLEIDKQISYEFHATKVQELKKQNEEVMKQIKILQQQIQHVNEVIVELEKKWEQQQQDPFANSKLSLEEKQQLQVVYLQVLSDIVEQMSSCLGPVKVMEMIVKKYKKNELLHFKQVFENCFEKIHFETEFLGHYLKPCVEQDSLQMYHQLLSYQRRGVVPHCFTQQKYCTVCGVDLLNNSKYSGEYVIFAKCGHMVHVECKQETLIDACPWCDSKELIKVKKFYALQRAQKAPSLQQEKTSVPKKSKQKQQLREEDVNRKYVTVNQVDIRLSVDNYWKKQLMVQLQQIQREREDSQVDEWIMEQQHQMENKKKKNVHHARHISGYQTKNKIVLKENVELVDEFDEFLE